MLAKVTSLTSTKEASLTLQANEEWPGRVKTLPGAQVYSSTGLGQALRDRKSHYTSQEFARRTCWPWRFFRRLGVSRESLEKRIAESHGLNAPEITQLVEHAQ